jgi:hypothetical protein
MDESDLFAGIGADPTRSLDGHPAPEPATPSAPEAPAASGCQPLPSPVDRVAPPPFVPAALVTHEHLAVPTLSHLRECAGLADTLSVLAEDCLRTRARFPHVLLSGPADSSKQTIARALAADLAAPFHQVDIVHLRSPDRMHATFRMIPDGAVVLVTGLDVAAPGALHDLARVVDGRASVRSPGLTDILRDVDREPWQRTGRAKPRGGRAYGDFTVVLSSRSHVATDSALHRWVQLQFFTRRDADTEAARMQRAFRWAGHDVDGEPLRVFAQFAIDFGMRTLQFVNGLAAFLRGCAPDEATAPDAAGGDIDLPPERLRAVLGHILRHSIDPARVRCPQPGESRIIEP